jgi:HK97 family phage portal protein
MTGLLNRMAAAASARSGVIDPIHPRDPQLAALFGLDGATSAGVSVTPDNARECPEVDACVGLIEDTIGTVPLKLYERAGDGTRRVAADHPLHRLVHDRPNGWQSSTEFRQMLEGWRQTHGNAYAEIKWSGSGPVELVPLHPNETRGVRLASGRVAYHHAPTSGPSRTLMASEVLHLRDHPFARDLVNGDSRVKRNRDLIGRAIATGKYLSLFFSNGAIPKTFLTTSARLSETQRDEFREQFERKHGGLENTHRVGLLQAGVDIKQIGVDNEKSQVVQAYELAVTQIAGEWGVPPHLIGRVSRSTSWGTGIEQQSIGFVVYYMRPKFVVWEQALNQALMSDRMRDRFYFEFDADGLLRGDFKTRMEGYALQIQWGLATRNEIRELMNRPRIEGGDDALTPLNMVPAAKILDVLLRSSEARQAAMATSVGDKIPADIQLNGSHPEGLQ